MKQVLNALAPILITGESGAGKSHWAEQLARQRDCDAKVHYVDLAALSQHLFLSELYGHMRGAFTGADITKRGLCDLVGKGTLILDEVGELSLENQKHLLSFLERREYRPVGANFLKKFDGKIIATTNKNLERMVEDGSFRQDLYYRLHIFHYRLPSYQQLTYSRRKDIFELIIDQLKKLYHLNDSIMLRDDALKTILCYPWPGNIRQLKNFCEYLLIYSAGKVVEREEAEFYLRRFSGEMVIKRSDEWDMGLGRYSYKQVKEGFEKSYIQQALQFAGGKINKTAMLTGINKTTLISKIRQYDINVLELKNYSVSKKVA